MLPANAQFVFGALANNTWHMHVYNRLRNRPTPHSIADILGLRESESHRPSGKDMRSNDHDSGYIADGFFMPPDSNTDSRGGAGSVTPYSNDDGRGTQNSRSSLADGETSSEGMTILVSRSPACVT